jgi:phosphohistidine phosphatase
MSRELWLFRHGKADRDIGVNDFDRPLKKRGNRPAERIGGWMKQQNLIPDLVIISPAQRAITTAKMVCKAIGLTGQSIQQDKGVYAQGCKRLKTVSENRYFCESLFWHSSPSKQQKSRDH